MKPKIGEPILIGNMNECEVPNMFDGGETMIKIGGDRSFSHDVWVCLAVEDDRCVAMKLCSHTEKPSWINFGSTQPMMIEYSRYPIYKCSEETLEAMTGYKITDDLLSAVKKQIEEMK